MAMKKQNMSVNPIGLKGNEINERMKELMGVTSINENKSNVVVELTKKGPDGKAYAIVRENHEWYIKVANKTTGLIAEDFKYIGGLQNKKNEAYPSYTKAVKHLTLKLKSLAEAYNYEGNIDIFKNDNLLNEEVAGFAGFAEMRGNGFTGEGNMEHNKPMDEFYGGIEEKKETKNNPWAICTASVGREDNDKYEACVMGVKKSMNIDESMTEEGWAEECWMRENMTEEEMAVDKMTKKEKEFAALAPPYDEITYADKIAGAKKSAGVDEAEHSLMEAIKEMDEFMNSLLKKKV